MSELIIKTEQCTLCGECLPACPFDALSIVEGRLVVGSECVLCGACVKICSESALEIFERRPASRPDALDSWRGVWVAVELNADAGGDRVNPVSHELIGEGRKLADKLGTVLSAVVMGSELDEVLDGLRRFPLDMIHAVEEACLADFCSETHASVLSELVRGGRPEILLGGATANGRAYFPRTAALLHTGLTADCTGLAVDTGRRILLQTRPAFGGNVMATIECPGHRPQMATVRPNVMARPAPGERREVDIVRWRPAPESLHSPVSVIRRTREGAEAVNISEADVVVAGGRGVGGAGGFGIIEELAHELGGVAGASRAAVDSGWMPYSAQVGQTGRVVQPKLYIACGISGAVQHLVGMRSADTVVAINSDPGAPIFAAADYGFVGDLHSIIPELIGAVRGFRGRGAR